MRNILKHLIAQPFIASTAIAAALHSTWALGTIFAGYQPEAALNVIFLGWLLPAVLIAFSLDIGLLATAHEIRNGQRTRAKFITFFVLSGSMFFLQFYYLTSHTPDVPVAAGVDAGMVGLVTVIRSLRIWIVPALLPLSTLLYTFSSAADRPLRIPDQQKRDNRESKRAALVEGMEAEIIVSNGQEVQPTEARPFLDAIRRRRK